MGIHSSNELRRLGLASSDNQASFDLYEFSAVESLGLRWESEGLAALELVLLGDKGRLVVKAMGIRNFRLPEVSSHLWLPELEIEDWSGRGLEGIRYQLISQTNRDFRLLCAEILIE